MEGFNSACERKEQIPMAMRMYYSEAEQIMAAISPEDMQKLTPTFILLVEGDLIRSILGKKDHINRLARFIRQFA